MGTATTCETYEPSDSDWIVIRQGHARTEVSFRRLRMLALMAASAPNELVRCFAKPGQELTAEDLILILDRREAKKGTGE